MLRIEFDELEPSSDSLLATYRDKPFTGIAYELDSGGQLISEASYVDGQKSGLSRDWSSEGRLLSEQSYAFGALHGSSREWYEDGQLRSEGAYELGICLREKEWMQNGELIRDFILEKESPRFATLQRLREGTFGKLLRAGEKSGSE